MLTVGDKVPSFSLKQTDGKVVKAEDWKGQRVVFYFYSADDTPGCTQEACSLRDAYDLFRSKGVQVYGISPDSVQSHQNFSEKFSLPFPLLADPDHEVAEAFGVWVEKNIYGKKDMGIARTTFLIDESGVIIEVVKKVDTENHAKQLMKFL